LPEVKMSIIERLPQVEKALTETLQEKDAYERAIVRRRQQNEGEIVEEVENIARSFAAKVSLTGIFAELKKHLSKQYFGVWVEEATHLQPIDDYYGWYSCEHEWIFCWSKYKDSEVHSFSIAIIHNFPFLKLRVSGGGTGEVTTDFDLGVGVANIDQEGFKDAVAKAFLMPRTETREI
jgi:hypothetical protein